MIEDDSRHVGPAFDSVELRLLEDQIPQRKNKQGIQAGNENHILKSTNR